MRRSLFTALSAFALFALPHMAAAQDAPVPFDFGQTAIGKAGKSEDAAVYMFEATTAEKVTFELWGAGHLGLTLYAPDGTVMLRAEGEDEATLSAYIPETAAYFLAVHQSSADGQYVLSGDRGNVPDPVLLSVAYKAGFRAPDGSYSCWIEPGHVIRTYYHDSWVDITVRRDGWYSSHRTDRTPVQGASRIAGRSRVLFEGEEVVVTHHRDDGPKTYRIPAMGLLQPSQEPERYRSYLCTD